MSKNRKEYIDQLLSGLKLLEERILSVKESDTLPFSFFSASFDQIEKISRSLHELELMQIGEMKAQMEQLVRFLSEQPKHTESHESISPGSRKQMDEPEQPIPEQPVPEQPVQQPFGEAAGIEKKQSAERIILPEYKDPRSNEAIPPASRASQTVKEKSAQEKTATQSLNDIMQAPPTLLDLKKGISLNDRFLFQRELFNNNRSEMNRVVELLNTLGSFEEAEKYLRSEHKWDFDHRTVKEFLLIIKKGFE